MEKSKTEQSAPSSWWLTHRGIGAGLLLLLIIGLFAWRFGAQIWLLASDEATLEASLVQLGWWGPLALIGINVAQILVAPIPGYVVQAAAGYLYGWFWGGIYGAIGLMVGAMLAMWLSRTLGRPLVERMVGLERLTRWEKVTFSTSTAVWFLLLLVPTGDLPYFMAGLAHVSYTKIFLLTLLIRMPSAFVVAAAGAGAWALSGWQLALLFGAIGLLVLGFWRFQEPLLQTIDRRVERHVAKQENP